MKESAMTYWGYHLRIDAGGCDLEKIKDIDYAAKYNQSLLELIKMVSMGDPWIKDCGPVDHPELCGITLLQPIETSSITAHMCNLTGDAYLDVFSCKPFDIQAVISHFEEWYTPECVDFDYKTRQARRKS